MSLLLCDMKLSCISNFNGGHVKDVTDPNLASTLNTGTIRIVTFRDRVEDFFRNILLAVGRGVIL